MARSVRQKHWNYGKCQVCNVTINSYAQHLPAKSHWDKMRWRIKDGLGMSRGANGAIEVIPICLQAGGPARMKVWYNYVTCSYGIVRGLFAVPMTNVSEADLEKIKSSESPLVIDKFQQVMNEHHAGSVVPGVVEKDDDNDTDSNEMVDPGSASKKSGETGLERTLKV